jgi:hypothetical protein
VQTLIAAPDDAQRASNRLVNGHSIVALLRLGGTRFSGIQADAQRLTAFWHEKM